MAAGNFQSNDLLCYYFSWSLPATKDDASSINELSFIIGCFAKFSDLAKCVSSV